ncbi:uncharacterized protein LOC107821901 [Nicotiana tabacum]|uniref:Uncharacterized protein LOC107821901 n=1 Tax=Nicotiana tabacum TaxID=4097 RepID=A0AC58TP95_TOBAC
MASSTAVKQKGKGISRPTKSIASDFDDKPLWNHVKVLQFLLMEVETECGLISGHGVAICKEITHEVCATMKIENEEAEKKKTDAQLNARKKADYVSLPEGLDLSQLKKRKSSNGGALEKSFNICNRNIADKLAARMFYASGLLFNLATSPYYKKYSEFLAVNSLPGYVPPTFNRLRTTLLAQEKAHINRKLQPIKDTWKRKGLSICSDGWSDIKRRPLINIMGASSGRPIFLKSINSSGIIKDGEYIAKLFIKAIEDVDAENVVQVITDNAEKSTHFKNCEWILKLIGQVSSLKNFVVNYDMALAIFQKYSELSLLKVAETRFASHIIMTSRIHRVKSSLEKMVMDDEWKNYKGDKVIKAKAREIKSLVMDDEWWDTIEYLLRCTEPIVSMLRSVDLDCPKLYLIYDMWDTMIEKVKVIVFEHEGKDLITGQSNFFATIQGILVARWNKSNTPLHCMSHSLVPKYYHESWLKGESNGLRRLAPNEDIEISQNRLKCFQRYFKDSNDLKKASLEYGEFCCGNGYFGEPHVIDAMGYEEPLSWWANHGVNAPLLQNLAYKLLSHTASLSCCERNWSTFSLIHNIKRNKLATSRAEDLVFIHYNLCLLSRRKEKYTSGPSKYWDLGGDYFNIDESINDLVELSIDEPQLEGVFFEEEVQDLQEVDIEEIEEDDL